MIILVFFSLNVQLMRYFEFRLTFLHLKFEFFLVQVLTKLCLEIKRKNRNAIIQYQMIKQQNKG